MSKTLQIAENLAIFTANHERVGDIFAPAVSELCRLAAIEQAAINNKTEPFGYFRCNSFGWEDCREDDEGAIALYERPPIRIIGKPTTEAIMQTSTKN
ncbi:hypothetical protein [Iodobacter fluviatilis]|uniref:Uncharacterized protein n=1 Tax=Iodobacter fluviatilis TaxID=537 RepID=A0A7G3GBK4_9NEIS|nr:hypothetical protein [Iodobacter fluviatilis]QBC44422.1 hypothetical protein C1H71_13385 [Iodobacter fluviatilis]